MRLKHVVTLVFACAVNGLSADRPTLSAPTVVGGELQFTLACESNSPYRIDASTNLQTWFPVATNFESGTLRQIRVPIVGSQGAYRALARTPLFNFALLARETIDLNGNSVIIDSFDSEDPNLSTAGAYDPSKRSDRGYVASDYGLWATGVTAIYGTVLTTSTGLVNIGAYGKVGDLSWHADETRRGFQEGPREDLDVTLAQVDAPFQVGIPPTSGLVGTVFYTYKLNSGNYAMNNLRLNSSEKMIVTGSASLYVLSQLTLSGNSSIVIAPGASLRLYTAATNVVFGGNGMFNSNTPSAFVCYGLPRNTNITISANGTFKGCIYAPNADLHISGINTNNVSFVGSIVARRISVAGDAEIHYDEALQRTGPFTW